MSRTPILKYLPTILNFLPLAILLIESYPVSVTMQGFGTIGM